MRHHTVPRSEKRLPPKPAKVREWCPGGNQRGPVSAKPKAVIHVADHVDFVVAPKARCPFCNRRLTLKVAYGCVREYSHLHFPAHKAK